MRVSIRWYHDRILSGDNAGSLQLINSVEIHLEYKGSEIDDLQFSVFEVCCWPLDTRTQSIIISHLRQLLSPPFGFDSPLCPTYPMLVALFAVAQSG